MILKIKKISEYDRINDIRTDVQRMLPYVIFLESSISLIEIRSWTSIIKVTDDPGNKNENKTENPFAYE